MFENVYDYPIEKRRELFDKYLCEIEKNDDRPNGENLHKELMLTRNGCSDKNTINMDIVLEQLEDYGKYKGILHCEGESFDNYIPVSVAKQIVRGRGLGGAIGYMEEE